MTSRKKVAVVGGGVAGLCMMKSLLEEKIIPVCYEKSSEHGGTWCYRQGVKSISSTMSTTLMNSSKETTVISTQIFPDDTGNFMRHDELFTHLMDYYKQETQQQFIHYDMEVIKVKRTSDYDNTGRWTVVVKNSKSQEVTSEDFDCVMLCTGQFARPIIPQYPGMGYFLGKIVHTQDLRTFESFKDKNVIVCGFGCSALDAATEVSKVANQVYLSARSHAWVFPRAGFAGLPYDSLLLRKLFTFILEKTSPRFVSSILHNSLINIKFNHHLYGIEPNYPICCREPVISDDIFPKLACGAIVLRKNIKAIYEDSVLFEDESEPTKVDAIILATGYKDDFSYLEDDVLVRENNGKIHLYKVMYPPHLKHPTLAFIGFILSWGPGFPLAELQTRWAVQLLSGNVSLPLKDVMMEDIQKRYETNAARFPPSDKMQVRVDYMPYADEIASQFGVKPNYYKMAISDPALFLMCVFGIYSSYQYRLQGVHKWNGARDAIMRSSERILKGYNDKANTHRKFYFTEFAFVLLMLLTILYYL